jgi:hypothetical protein
MTEIVRTFGIKLVSIEEFAKNMIAVS